MIKKLTTILLLTLLIAGCAQGTGETQPVNEPPIDQSEQPIAQPDDSLTTEDPLPEPSLEDQVPENNPEEQTESDSSQPESVEKTYYMNNIFDIKPIDDETDANVVLLTFDDGPKDIDMVNGLLDTLEKHEAKAIFFVNGFRVQSNPELLQLIYDEGHAIGNHSWDHINLKKENNETIKQQVDDVQQIVEETIGVRPLFFRPPHGAYNEYLRNYVTEQGMLFMNWSNGSLDWDAGSQTPEAVIANVLDQLRPGSNILMHELPWTVEALDDLLTELKAQGYGFVDPHSIQIETAASDATSDL